ncbi:hypothetical protein L209DRAFT_225030 [Thermothelomyces heterothallicus CBS 203.75]
MVSQRDPLPVPKNQPDLIPDLMDLASHVKRQQVVIIKRAWGEGRWLLDWLPTTWKRIHGSGSLRRFKSRWRRCDKGARSRGGRLGCAIPLAGDMLCIYIYICVCVCVCVYVCMLQICTAQATTLDAPVENTDTMVIARARVQARPRRGQVHDGVTSPFPCHPNLFFSARGFHFSLWISEIPEVDA